MRIRRSLEAEPLREEREEMEMDAREAQREHEERAEEGPYSDREAAEAERLHDQHPGRWGDHASPARMRRDIERDREEERYR
jgi:hypothetical protein